MRRPRRRTFVVLALLLAALGLGTWSVAIEPGMLRERQVDLALARWPEGRAPLRVAFIADLHVGAPHITLAKLDDIVARVNAAAPDLVLIGGDYIAHVLGGRAIAPEAIAARLRPLKARLGVFSILGNHDHVGGQGARMRDALTAAGIVVLENAARRLDTAEGPLWIVGLDTDRTARSDPVFAFRDVPLGGAEPVFVLAHDPGIFPLLPTGIAAVFAGHTHGGQVRVPGIGALVNASSAPLRHSLGVIREHGRVMVVTAGIGTSILPIRFNCVPEIVVLTIRRDVLKP